MKSFKILGAAAMTITAVGCVTSQAPVANTEATISSACIQAVEVETNNHDVVVLGSDPRGGVQDYTLQVGGTGIWSCMVTSSGQVTNVGFLGSDGSPLA